MNSFRLFINLGLALSFTSLFSTGLSKFPGLFQSFGIDTFSWPMSTISLIHDWSGLFLIFFVILHLINNFSYIKKLFSLKIKPWYLLILLFIVSAFWIVYYIQEQADPVRMLQSREIREYQGEDLSSIVDLQETSIGGIQYLDAEDYRLKITGLVENQKTYTYAEVLDFPKYSKVVDLNCVVGWSARILWEGFLVKDILEEAGISPKAKVAIFYASDGFSTSLPLDFLIDNDIILAYKVNDVILPQERGFPFQLVAEQKWGYKWVKWLTKIELSDDVNYRGTYESAGYSNEADISGPKREP